MPRPLIALLTDFGTTDHFVGAMKGVMLGICPDAALVDITHEVAPHDVLEGALALGACFGVFPAGTVFLAVVDPGVGSTRRGIAAICGPHAFVAPDNGILTAVFRERPPACVVELSELKYARTPMSRTFEGRDRFAPAAAWLATGLDLTALGAPIEGCVALDIPEPAVLPGLVAGEVLRVDRFGNVVTNIDRAAWDRGAAPGEVRIRLGEREMGPLVQTYAEIAAGQVGALFGSGGRLELSAREARAASILDARRGDPVTAQWLTKGRSRDGL
jgi:hypothetical protein